MDLPRQPVHRTIVVWDVEGFGDPNRTNAHQVTVRDGLYQVLRQAFQHAGICWADCDHEDRGDGVFVLAPAQITKVSFVDGLPHALVRALREHNASHSPSARIRLRMAVHAGEVAYDEHGVTSAAVNLAFRLVDAAPLKAALAESPGVLAVITSGWFFDEVVQHNPACYPAGYRRVRVTVKETATIAWISRPDHPYPPAQHLTDPAAQGFSAAMAVRGLLATRPTGELPVPRQLPLAVRDFTGRAEHLTTLDTLIPDSDNPDLPPDPKGAVVITAIDGTAGVGKTTLAVFWAHRVQHRFPDGTLYINLRGYGPGQPATPAEVLDGFLFALGCPPQRIPVGLQAQTALYRSLLAGRRVLIVLDNADTAQQVRPLLPGSPGCLVLITSRASLTGLVVSDGAVRLTLDLLTPDEALDLLRGILGTDRVTAEPQAVSALIGICARLPLALRIATGRAATRPHHCLADMVAEMNADHTRLDALHTLGDDPTSVRAVFDWSYQRLDTRQARLFRRLGQHPGPEFSLHAAVTVANLDLHETRQLLDTLTNAHLLEVAAKNRYRFHDLMRAYAADRAEHDESSHDRDQARYALLEFYAYHSLAAYRVLFPAFSDWHPVFASRLRPHVTISFHTTIDAKAWLYTEQANLIAAAHQAADHNLPKLAILISHINSETLYFWGALKAMFDLAELAVTVARHSDDRHSECHALLYLTLVYQRVGQWAEALAACQEALVLARTFGEPWLEAGALNEIGWVCTTQGRYAEAIDYLQLALPLSSGAQRGRLQGAIESNLADAHIGLGDYEGALEHAENSVALRRPAGDRHGEAYVLGMIARIRQNMAAHSEAIALCENALNTMHDYGYTPYFAEILDTLGTSLQHTNDIKRGITCWRQALDIYDKFADPRAAHLRARLQTLETNS
jgi:tetratricopeptide (TPR) repeat protein